MLRKILNKMCEWVWPRSCDAALFLLGCYQIYKNGVIYELEIVQVGLFIEGNLERRDPIKLKRHVARFEETLVGEPDSGNG
jgi:hypothetical protein